MSPARRAAAIALVAALVAGCRSDQVVVSFRPPPGRTFRYATTVTTTTTTELAGQAPATTQQVADLRSEQRVLDGRGDEIRVQIVVDRPGAASRTYVARYDRGAQLTDVERVEGIPAEALGDLGLTEIFPAAAGAPPARGLRPGDTWAVDEHLRLPGAADAVALTGSGRLVELAVADGRRTARIRSTTALPLRTAVTSAGGVQRLDGSQSTDLDAAYDVDDGSVVEGTAVTVGRFDLVLAPPDGQPGAPVTGHLVVEIRTTIRRL